MREKSPFPVVGIGADGWSGLSEEARTLVLSADVVIGGARQLAYLPPEVEADAVEWPARLLSKLDGFLAEYFDRRICVLASGDPLLSGIGTTLIERGYDIQVLPTLSSVTLARARLGWSAEQTEVVSVVGRDIERVARALTPGRKVLVLGAKAPALRKLLRSRKFAKSTLRALENLGSPDERISDGWEHDPGPLTVFAIDCVGKALPLIGLPDDAYDHDGQLTKRDVRISALARLAPSPGELLWDVGAGAGSIAIEWLRMHPLNRAIAIEGVSSRADRIERNAYKLGVPQLRVVCGLIPDALVRLPKPDAIFIGGALTTPDLITGCVENASRIVAHAVTLQGEWVLADAHRRYGGELTRISVQRIEPLGHYDGWKPSRTVTQWCKIK
ncbi:precorrin-6y C5,15-methyltransferase (decarboxylating) subunit CbiE [Amycolatopsis sp. NPDC059021]|uniref:precorrin-6y C5,15-methyltransferase (decarboxylating) subunit CbiE n=1 Tax=Amycolatopsis sp. NPDC059021 TaxID=3346704 RepID=UPI00366B0EC7